MALTHEILNSHSVSALKKEISKTNIKGYSKMKKNEIVSLMMTHKTRFNHIKSAVKAPKKVAEAPKKVAEAPKKKAEAPKKVAETPKKKAEAPKKKIKFTKKKLPPFLGDVGSEYATDADRWYLPVEETPKIKKLYVSYTDESMVKQGLNPKEKGFKYTTAQYNISADYADAKMRNYYETNIAKAPKKKAEPKKAEPKDKKIKVAETVKEIMDDLMGEIDESAHDWTTGFAKPPTRTQFDKHLASIISYTKKNIRQAIKETPMENEFNKEYPKKEWYRFHQ